MMKNVMKTVAVATMLMTTVAVSAQKTEKDSYGPTEGTFGVEVQFNPFSNNFKTFKIDGLQVRYFLSEEHAVRANLQLGFYNNSQWTSSVGYGYQIGGDTRVEPQLENYTGTDASKHYAYDKDVYDHVKDNSTKYCNFNLGLTLGYENHFYKTGRMDLYAGAQIGFAMDKWSTTTEKAENYSIADDHSSWKTLTTEVTGEGKGSDGGTKNSTFTLRGGLFTGIDFYVTKNLYVGAELGLNLESVSYNTVETTKDVKQSDFSTTGSTKSVTTDVDDQKSTFNLSLNAVPALRLGWTF